MSESPRASKETIDDLSRLQYGTTLNLKLRWEVYKHAEHPVDFYEKAAELLDLDGDETILDVGCADGSGLSHLRDMGHRGRLMGLDIDPFLFTACLGPDSHEANSANPIEFFVGSAQDLPQEDDSIDALMALFMLYHAPDPEEALGEFKRVLKSQGKLAVATSGKGNKQRHRQFERAIAYHLGLMPPPVFSEKFNSEVAGQQLPRLFTLTHHFKQSSRLRITAESLEDYINSLMSMKDAFDPIPPAGDLRQAIEVVALRAEIQPEIERSGFFTDTVERDLYICQMP